MIYLFIGDIFIRNLRINLITAVVSDMLAPPTRMLQFASCIVMNQHYRSITPRFNDACRAQKRKGSCLERVYCRTRSGEYRKCWIEQLSTGQEFYRQVQNIYWQTLISNSPGNACKLWNMLSSVMEKKKTSHVQTGINTDIFLKCFNDKISDLQLLD